MELDNKEKANQITLEAKKKLIGIIQDSSKLAEYKNALDGISIDSHGRISNANEIPDDRKGAIVAITQEIAKKTGVSDLFGRNGLENLTMVVRLWQQAEQVAQSVLDQKDGVEEEENGEIWYNGIERDIFMAVRKVSGRKRVTDQNDPSKKIEVSKSENEIKKDKKDQSEAIERLTELGVKMEAIAKVAVDDNLRSQVIDAVNVVRGRKESLRDKNMNEKIAADILFTNLGVKKPEVSTSETNNKPEAKNDKPNVDEIIKKNEDWYSIRFLKELPNEGLRDFEASRAFLNDIGYSKDEIQKWEEIYTSGNRDGLEKMFGEARKIYLDAIENRKDPELRAAEKDVKDIIDNVPKKYILSELNGLLKKQKNFGPAKIYIYSEIDKLENAEAVKPPTININELREKIADISNLSAFFGDVKQQRQKAQRLFNQIENDTNVPQELKDEVYAISRGGNVKFGLFEKKNEIGEIVGLLSEEDMIRSYCFEQIFDKDEHEQAQSADRVLNLLTAQNGFLATSLFKTPSEVQALYQRTKEIVDELGLDNWIGARKTLDAHAKLKGTPEITAQVLNAGLFNSPFVEKWFAGEYPDKGPMTKERMVHLPGEKEAIDIQKAVSGAMLDLKNYFDKTDYYIYVGADSATMAAMFKELGINKYVGVVAFSMLLSNLILTECEKTSTDDPFLYMIRGDKRRVAAYNVGAKDPTLRGHIQEQLASGGYDVVNKNTKKIYREGELPPRDFEIVKSITEEWLAESLPCHLIPTGRSGKGMEHLRSGDWLRWKVENTFTIAERNYEITQLATNKGRIVEVAAKQGLSEIDLVNLSTRVKAKTASRNEVDYYKKLKDETLSQVIANDTGTRIEEMKQALLILDAYKLAMKPESGVETLLPLRSALAVYTKVKLNGAGWVNSDDKIDKEFCYGVVEYDRDGNIVRDEREALDHDEWATKAMLTALKTFMYTHSIDYLNKSPLSLLPLSRVANDMLSYYPQSDEDAYFGFNTEIRDKYRKEFVKYVDKLWGWYLDILNYAEDDKQLNKLPRWYYTGGSLPDGVKKAAKELAPDEDGKYPDDAWKKVKKDLGFN